MKDFTKSDLRIFRFLGHKIILPDICPMYKLLSEDEDRHCLECGEPLYGRTDKKFCNTSCRSKYHGQLRRWHNKLYTDTLDCLNRNYEILEHLFRLHGKGCELTELAVMGFRKDMVTHKVQKKGKHLEYRCFDFVYNLSDNKLFNLRRL